MGGMLLTEVLVPLGFFTMIAALVIVPRYLKSLERQKLQDTLRAAVERGQPIPSEVIEAMSLDAKPRPSPERDLRVGIIWLGIGLGQAALALMVGMVETDAIYPLMGLAAFPTFIGLAFILISLLSRGRK